MGIFVDRLGAALLLASCAAGACAATPELWSPGLRYQTEIKYEIAFTNAVLALDADTNKPYRVNGAYVVPCLEICPVVQFVTEGMTRQGTNCHAKRRYIAPAVTFRGLPQIKWKSDRFWTGWIPTRLGAWRDDDLDDWKKLLSSSDDALTEPFAVFDLGGDQCVSFDTEKQALFMKWYAGRWDETLAARIGAIEAASNGSSGMAAAPTLVRDVIAAEGRLTAAMLFDSPRGAKAAVARKSREWTVDASVLSGLLANERLKRLVEFEGQLRLALRRPDIDKVKKVFHRPFSAIRLEALGSSGLTARFEANGRRYELPLVVSPDIDNGNQVELWFDEDNETLRYARIRIVEENYDGGLPNPQLGRRLGKLSGHISGTMIFTLEYTTEIHPVLGK